MIRVSNLEPTLHFFCDLLGMVEIDRKSSDKGRFTLVFLAASEDESRAREDRAPMLELTYNWDPEEYSGGRNFGHLAFRVDDIYTLCETLQASGITINRPPRDGRMAFILTPDNISIELLQKGDPLVLKEPWLSMENTGTW
jgi:lactoylglutathione lyase